MYATDWYSQQEPLDNAAWLRDGDSASKVKRATRACDQCRKTKSKCERPTEDGPCRNCMAADIGCTFNGPSYKRGPPKGYLHAVEQRWYQAEVILGAILSSSDPHARAVISALFKDELAAEVLSRVNAGPFGPLGRSSQPPGATMEELFHSFMATTERHTQRQSRLSRETVSSGREPRLSPKETALWQDRLTTLLSSPRDSEEPLPIRRRLEHDGTTRSPNFSEMYTMEGTASDTDGSQSHRDTSSEPAVRETGNAMGQLSLDENHEVRYHGEASGLHLLGESDRTDDRKEGGLWKLPMARVWPKAEHAGARYPREDEIAPTVQPYLPSPEEQEKLIGLYFTYFHPSFPAIDRPSFFEHYQGGKGNVSKLLLFSMFSIAVRFCAEEGNDVPKGVMMSEAGCEYLDGAKEILNKVYHHSSLSTCQALLILGMREFGIGSFEQGWLYIGMGTHMAIDLGLHRDSEQWKYHGKDLFSPEESRTRQLVWWCSNLADKHVAVFLGRPVCLHVDDFDTGMPREDKVMEDELWVPHPTDETASGRYRPIKGCMPSTFCASAALSLITTNIIERVYSVRCVHRLEDLTELETSLQRWYLDLPECVRLDPSNRKAPVPPPHVLVLHQHYWSIVLLLYRAFLPRKRDSYDTISSPSLKEAIKTDQTAARAFDQCQSAAVRISLIATMYKETFGLRRTPPFMNSYILTAGIMHTVCLSVRPSEPQAVLGLRQCLDCLKELQLPWPGAVQAWDLLNGVKLHVEDVLTPLVTAPDRPKRNVDEFLADQDNTGPSIKGPVRQRSLDQTLLESPLTNPEQYDARTFAQLLGLDVPSASPEAQVSDYSQWPPYAMQAQSSQPWAALSQLDLPAYEYQPGGAGDVMNNEDSAAAWINGVSNDYIGSFPFEQGFDQDQFMPR